MADGPEGLADGLGLPEGPRWRDGWLYFTDVWACKVYRRRGDGRLEDLGDVPGRPNGLGFLPDGSLLVVSMTDRRLWRLGPEGLTVAADLSPFAGDMANDMAVDGRGRAYVGGHVLAPGKDGLERLANGRDANLVLADFSDPSRPPQISLAAEGLKAPNGMVVTPDGHTLIVAETSGRRLTAFTIAADGALCDRRTWADLDIAPDGICLDQDGCIWAATPFPPSSLTRVAQGGKILERIAMEDGAAVFACALGGADGRSLFSAEATYPTQPDDRRGRLRRRSVTVPGAGSQQRE
jgi:sugar lactone lactonase YvrE